MANAKELDARELEAPLPLEYALKIAIKLDYGDYLKMLHRMKPCKLESALEKLDISSVYFEQDGVHYIFAWLKGDEETKQYVLEALKDEYGRTLPL